MLRRSSAKPGLWIPVAASVGLMPTRLCSVITSTLAVSANWSRYLSSGAAAAQATMRRHDVRRATSLMS